MAPPCRALPLRWHRATLSGIGLSITAALLAGCLAHGTTAVVDTSFDAAPLLTEVTVQRFQYPTDGIADPELNWADLYLPPGEHREDSVPLAVLVHGGAHQSELGAEVFDPLARDLASRGMAVYNIEYRREGSGGGWPTTFRDVASALDNVVEVDRRFPQVSTDDELIVGHGTGAQLAVWGSTRHRLTGNEVGARPAFRPTRVVSIGGPLDLVDAAEQGDDQIVAAVGGTPADVPGRYSRVDPIQNIDPGTPVVAMHGSRDATVDPENSRRYVDAVNRSGGRAKLVMFADQDHVSLVSGKSRAYPRVLEIIRYVSAADLDETTA